MTVLRSTEKMLLALISEKPGLTCIGYEPMLPVSIRSVRNCASRLKEIGFVKGRRDIIDDGRRCVYFITEKGIAFLNNGG